MVLGEISLCCDQFIISYNAFELRVEYDFRITEGFRNHYTTADLIILIQKYGFRLNGFRYFDTSKILLDFKQMKKIE